MVFSWAVVLWSTATLLRAPMPRLRAPPPQLQAPATDGDPFAATDGDPFAGQPKVSSGLLFQDSKQAITKRAERERELLEPNTREMKAPKRGRSKSGSGGGFGKQQGAQAASESIHAETVRKEGVCLVKNVLTRERAAELRKCVEDELARAYEAVERHPESSIGRFNVPAETFDPLRGYLLLPLRDEASVESGTAKGPLVQAVSELLESGSLLGDLFETTCGGGSAELYDLVGLRTEASATRQPIHSDTPWQKVPGLFCAFIALQDVRYEMGTTVFLPGTHKQTKARKSFDDGQFDGRRDAMLAKAPSRYSMLRAGDAAFFNMNTLHAGTANFAADHLGGGGEQRLLFILTFRNLRAREQLGHAPNLRFGYRNRAITLDDMRKELLADEPFAGIHAGDGRAFGDGLDMVESS